MEVSRARHASRTLVLLVAALSCTDGGGPLGPDTDFAIVPRFLLGASNLLPIHRIRVTVLDAEDRSVVTVAEVDVNPDADEWTVDVEIPSPGPAEVILQIEGLNVGPGGELTVEFSGESEPISPGDNLSGPVDVDIEVYPGPLTNLGVESVEILDHPESVPVGGTLQLQAVATTSSGTPPIVFWESLDPQIASVDPNGLVTGLEPGGAEIVAAAGPESDGTEIDVVGVAQSITIAPTDVTLSELDAEVEFEATVLDASGEEVEGVEVAWTSSDPSVAVHQGDGVFVTVGEGVTEISAFVVGQPEIGASTTLTVALEDVVGFVEVVPDELDVEIGQSVQLVAEVRSQGGDLLTDREVEWSSDDPTVAMVSEVGVVTGVAPGLTTIRAASEGISGLASVTVSELTAAEVLIEPASTTIQEGESTLLTARVFSSSGEELSDRTVTWASSDPAIATVSEDGEVVGVSEGVVTVTASAGDASGTATVTVIGAPVASIVVTPSDATVNEGATVQLSAETRDAGGNVLTGRTITWASSDESVATVSATGLVTGVAEGSATITASSEGVDGTATVTVERPPVATVVIAPADVTVAVGATAQLTAEPRDAGGNALPGRTVTWASSNPSIATVDGNGLVTAVAIGSATVTASSEGVDGTAQITVTAVPVAAVVVTPSGASIDPGSTVQLSAEPRDSGGNALTGRLVTWASSDDNVATVDASGLVTAVTPGTVTITATSEGIDGTATVTVNAPPGVPLVCGSHVAGSIDAAAEVDLFNFTGSAGETVTFTIVHTSGFDNTIQANLRLLSPSSIQLLNLFSHTRAARTLSSNGVHTVEVRAEDLVRTGSYEINFECLNPATSGVALTPGTRVDSSLDLPAEADLYTFDGNNGESFNLMILETAGFPGGRAARAHVYRPDGSSWTAPVSNSRTHLRLTQTGTYAVLIEGDDYLTTGSYSVQVDRVTPPQAVEAALAPGDLSASSIDQVGHMRIYEFDGSSGEVFTFTGIETSGFASSNPLFTVVSPAGQVRNTFNSNTRSVLTLTETGTHVITVRANDYRDIGGYSLNIERLLPAAADGTLSAGVLLSDDITFPGEADIYTFDGTAGELVNLMVLETAGFAGGAFVRAHVYRPDGSSWTAPGSNSRSNLNLTQTGSYIVVVEASDYLATGTYALQVDRVVQPQAVEAVLNPGDQVPGTISTLGEVKLYEFDGSSGEVFTFTGIETSGFATSNPLFTVYSPSGSQRTSFGANTRQPLTLNETGTHVVMVRANNFVDTGGYSLNIERLLPAVADGTLSAGVLLSDDITLPGEADVYTFNGTSGDIMSMSVVETAGFAGGPFVRAHVYRPDGSSWTAPGSNSRSNLNLTQTGSYIVVVEASDYVSTGSYAIELVGLRPPAPVTAALSDGVPVAGSIAQSGDQVVYTFAGVSGNNYTVAIADTSFDPGNAFMVVYSPSISTLGSTSNSSFSLTAGETGNFVIVVTANDLVSTGSFQVTVTLN